MNYKVVINESEEGFSVSCPGLPGCWSQGQTESEALENIQDGIREYLETIDDLLLAAGNDRASSCADFGTPAGEKRRCGSSNSFRSS